MNLIDDIKTEARNLGFFSAGITSAYPVPDYNIYINWLEHSYNANMAYLGFGPRSLHRANPNLLLPNCRTVISLGMQHPGPASISACRDERLFGYVAAYARQSDYHQVIRTKLKYFVDILKKLLPSSFNSRGFCDTAPILERSYGRRAGLGWIGKNSCLINPLAGSYFFLAELLLDIDLDYQPSVIPDRCGTCNRCIEACPTRCILPNRMIDARRCISYLTIENKSDIPEDLRADVGSHIFGCDICQTVCPWNNSQKIFPDIEANNKNKTVSPGLVDLIHLTQEEFAEKFHNTPILRAKYSGFQRNVVTALGNSHNSLVLPYLQEALEKQEDPMIIRHIEWSLAKLLQGFTPE